MSGETFDEWRVIARSPRGTIDVMFAPVITVETHPALSEAKAPSNNTAEMTAMLESPARSWPSWLGCPQRRSMYL